MLSRVPIAPWARVAKTTLAAVPHMRGGSGGTLALPRLLLFHTHPPVTSFRISRTQRLLDNYDSNNVDLSQEPPCVENLRPEMEELLCGSDVRLTCKLHTLKEELTWLHQRPRLPIPEELTETQWMGLMALEQRETRNKYMFAILQGREDEVLESLQEEDQLWVQGLQLDEDVVQELVGDSELLQERLSKIKLEHERMRQNGFDPPIHLKKQELSDLLTMDNINLIGNTLRFYMLKRTLTSKDKVQKIANTYRQEKILAQKKEEEARHGHIVYGLGNNTIFEMVNKPTVNRNLNWRVMREYMPGDMAGQPMIIDFQFIQDMSLKDARSLLMREVVHVIKENRERFSPAALYIVNFQPDCHLSKTLLEYMPNLTSESEPVIVTEKSYTDLFPKERLLYLSPDSKIDLMHHDPDDVYIIGGLNDKSNSSPVTMAQAKREGIRHARLPARKILGRHVELTVNAMANVLSDFRFSKSWQYALRWVPPRFLRHMTANDDNVHAYLHAHAELSPTENVINEDIYPAEYQRRYAELLKQYQVEHGLKHLRPLAREKAAWEGKAIHKKNGFKRQGRSYVKGIISEEEQNWSRRTESSERRSRNQPSVADILKALD